MKILWLCNIEPPIVSKVLRQEKNVFGGWLDETANQIIAEESNTLFITFPSETFKKGNFNNLSYSSFFDNQELFFENCLKDFQPDIIHIWGTEYLHTFKMVGAANRLGFINKVIISIQGLVSIISKHYCTGLPDRVIYEKTIHELLRGNNINQCKKDFEYRGVFETESIRQVKHVIGRTDFDYAATMAINPSLNYHFCNETLRSVFYYSEWDYKICNKNNIFVSQCSYPVKGFHLLLEAAKIIKDRGTPINIITTGADVFQKNRDYLHRSSYDKYLCELIEKYNLKENISFLGRLNENQMLEQYLKCNIFVSPSTIENSSNSIGEAMLLGCPVISSDVGGIKSLMEDKKEGLIYPADAPYMLADLIIRLFNNPELATELGGNARKKALITHNKEVNYKTLIEIYNSII